MDDGLKLVLEQMDKRLSKIEGKLEDLSAFKIKITAIAGFILIIAKLAGPIIDKLM